MVRFSPLRLGPVFYVIKALKSMLYMNALIVSFEFIHLGFLERRCSPNNALKLDVAVSTIHLLPYPTFFLQAYEPLIDPLPVAHHGRGMEAWQ
jgi:hypothetical protein